MKMLLGTSRKYFKIMICPLAILLSVCQMYHILLEINHEDLKEQNPTELITSQNICDGIFETLFSWSSIFVKCSMAFLFGGIVSDIKFTKFGIL
jgi:hypothetical protein